MIALAALLVSFVAPPATLAVDGLLVGTYKSGHWTAHGDKLPTWKNVRFQQVLLGRMGKSIVVPSAVIMEMSGCPYLKDEGARARGAQWCGPTPSFPRKVTAGGPVPAATQKLVQTIVAGKGFDATRIDWVKFVIGDFDGDKRPDQLIQCRNVEKGEADPKHQWSMVLYLQGGKKPNTLSWHVFAEAESLEIDSLEGLADFDHDGVYELVLGRQYIEGNGGTVFSLRKSGPRTVVDKGA